MRTAKFLFGLIAIVFFIPSLANAQNSNWQSRTQPYSSYNPCYEEMIEGTLTIKWKWKPNGDIMKMSIDAIGQESGAHYEGTYIQNVVEIDNGPKGATVYTITDHIQMKRDNKPAGIWKLIAHYTINADGDRVVDFKDHEWRCH